MAKASFVSIFTIVIVIVIFLINYRADSNQANDFCLTKSFDYYKKIFLTADGRILDPDKGNITTSEGQSYIMLRSVIQNDRETFDKAFLWTKNNLQREDNLFAWLWGKNKDGAYKILDYNSASDADIDIAFSLILAYEKWGDDNYLPAAVAIINSIWDKETKRIGNHLVLMPGANQTLEVQNNINPSYFNPYAFRFFQKYDNLHDWNCLIDSSYYYWSAVSSKTQTGLFPNWFLINNTNNYAIIIEESPKGDFSYDAVRVFMRAYLDYTATGEERALPILKTSEFFVKKWQNGPPYYTNYKSNGTLSDNVEFIGSIAVILPAMSLYDTDLAAKIYQEKIEKTFNDTQYWEAKHDYYAKNLLWFGCYLYNKHPPKYRNMNKMSIFGD